MALVAPHVEVAVLLGDFGPAGEHDVHATGPDVRNARTEVTHQPLPVKAVLDALVHLGAHLFLLGVVFHVTLLRRTSESGNWCGGCASDGQGLDQKAPR